MKKKNKNLLFLYLLTGGKSLKVVRFLLNNMEEIKNSRNFREIVSFIENSFKKKIKSEKIKKAEKLFDAILKDVEEGDFGILTFFDENYPKELKNIHFPPLLLFYKGNLKLLSKTKVGIVGTRKASEYGKKVAYKLSRFLSERDVTIVSGLAKGIDRFSHLGGLEGNGSTIGVLGNGIKVFYPYENKKLQLKIFENGLILSEFLPYERPNFYNFPRRNRIVSAFSETLVVVEAGIKSGAMITVSYALEQGKDVLSVPGSIFSKNSMGTNKMILEGAYPLISIEEILNFVKIDDFKNERELLRGKEKIEVSLTEEEEKVYKLIFKYEEMSIDELVELTSLSISSLSEILFSLELKGAIESRGGFYKLKEFEKKYE